MDTPCTARTVYCISKPAQLTQTSQFVVNPARLNKRLWLQKREVTKSSLGQRSDQWIAVIQLWAEIKPLSSDESIASSAEVSAVSHEIKIRYRSGVTADMRFYSEGGRVFDITAAPVNQHEKSRYLVCKCVERFSV